MPSKTFYSGLRKQLHLGAILSNLKLGNLSAAHGQALQFQNRYSTSAAQRAFFDQIEVAAVALTEAIRKGDKL